MASSSSSYRSPGAYDVFINHRGPDVKDTLALQLYNYLHDSSCRVFLDCEELKLGDSIPSSLEQAISSSSVQIAIFSPRYAESSWCLNELVLMLKSKALFIPVFYDVDPHHLRHIETGEYGKAFSNFEEKERHLDNLEDWKDALRKAAEFSGHIFKSDQTNKSGDLFRQILSTVRNEVERRKPLPVAEHPVGLNGIMTDFQSEMKQERKQGVVTIVGIFGSGGCGKTTLAKHFFNTNRGKYKRSCFLFVRELCAEGKSISLQAKLLRDLFGESYPGTIKSTSEWAADLKQRLSSCRSDPFLIVIDDINEEEQLDSLLFGDTLGSDSLVIVTTRDEGLLIRAGITIRYKVKNMKPYRGRKLFCRHAFGHRRPKKGYEDLVYSFVKLCGGLPLSLRIFGSLVRGREKHDWELQLAKAQKTAPRKIKETLKISYKALEREEKQIFKDTACFFIGKEKSMALNIWEASGWNAEIALRNLIEKCLVEVKVKDFKHVLDMHDHLRDLGRDLADKKSSPARLWRPEYLPNSLESVRNMLNEANRRWLQSIRWDDLIPPADGRSKGPIITFFAGSSIDCAPWRTELLWLEFDLEEQSLDAIPSWIPLQNLRYLRVVNGHLKRLWKDDIQLSSSSRYLRVVNGHLKRLWKDDIQLSSSSATPLPLGSGAQVPVQLKELLLQRVSLEEFSNSLGMLTHLENIFFDYEVNKFSKGKTLPLKSLSETLRKLRKLKSLVVRGFPLSGELSLAGFRDDCSNELTNIDLSFLKDTSRVSISGQLCSKLENLNLYSMENLIEVDLNLLKSLKRLVFKFCKKLKRISGSFGQGDLVTLNIMACRELVKMPSLKNLSSLEEISVDQCGKLQEISGIEKLKGLKSLYISTESAGIWKCIQRMEKLPSEITIAIGRAVDGAESVLNANLFSSVISAKAVRDVHRNEKGDVEPLLITPDSLSGRVMCALVEAHSEADFTTAITGSKPIPQGERILTFVFPRGTEGFQTKTFDPNWTPFHANVKKECIVSVWKGEEGKLLDIFKLIIHRLYKTEEARLLK